MEENKKYCKHCGELIDKDCIICPKCGKQVEATQQAQPNVIINNTNTNTNTIRGFHGGKEKNKWLAFCLCLFIGYLGAHKFYEGKIGMGIVYLFTFGLFGIGWLIDCVVLLTKPNPYYL